MKIREIQRSARTLTPNQLLKFDAWLHKLLDELESKKSPSSGTKTKRQVLEERRTINKTYRLEGVRCGKKNCHCAEGKMHGPYWYAYWTEGGRTKSQYIGKKLPLGVRKT